MPAAYDAASDFGLHFFVQQVRHARLTALVCVDSACLTVAAGCFSDGLIAGLPEGSRESETHSIAVSQHAQAAAGHHRHLTHPSEASEAAQAEALVKVLASHSQSTHCHNLSAPLIHTHSTKITSHSHNIA